MKEGETKEICDALDNVMKYVRNEGYDQGFDKGVDNGVLQGQIMDVQQLMKNGNMNLTDAIRLLGINGHTEKQITQIIQSQMINENKKMIYQKR